MLEISDLLSLLEIRHSSFKDMLEQPNLGRDERTYLEGMRDDVQEVTLYMRANGVSVR